MLIRRGRTSSFRRRCSTLGLCGACVFLTWVGASYANAPTLVARQAAHRTMCCFRLSISDAERVFSYYQPAPSGTGGAGNPSGYYEYRLSGNAYGLAQLDDVGGTMDLQSTYGGVAAASVDETNQVTFEGQPFGCPNNMVAHSYDDPAFRRTKADTPEYDPPRGRNGGGVVYFGDPFDTWGPRCNEFLDAENMVEQLAGRQCGEQRLLQTPGDPTGGPICDPGANPTKALLSGEHQVRITCTEHATWPDSEAYVAIVIKIVHVSPDDRKHQMKTLRSYVGKDAHLGTSPAQTALQKSRFPSSSPGGSCTSGS